MRRLLVTGGSKYQNDRSVWAALDVLQPLAVIQGGCSSGADLFAREWAYARKKSCWTFFADWPQYGLPAGPIRNSWMLSESHPQAVLAFPGANGTADMVFKAKRAGLVILDGTWSIAQLEQEYAKRLGQYATRGRQPPPPLG